MGLAVTQGMGSAASLGQHMGAGVGECTGSGLSCTQAHRGPAGGAAKGLPSLRVRRRDSRSGVGRGKSQVARALLARGDESDDESQLRLRREMLLESNALGGREGGGPRTRGEFLEAQHGGSGGASWGEYGAGSDDTSGDGDVLRRELLNGAVMWLLSTWPQGERHRWQAGGQRCRSRKKLRPLLSCPPPPSTSRRRHSASPLLSLPPPSPLSASSNHGPASSLSGSSGLPGADPPWGPPGWLVGPASWIPPSLQGVASVAAWALLRWVVSALWRAGLGALLPWTDTAHGTSRIEFLTAAADTGSSKHVGGPGPGLHRRGKGSGRGAESPFRVAGSGKARGSSASVPRSIGVTDAAELHSRFSRQQRNVQQASRGGPGTGLGSNGRGRGAAGAHSGVHGGNRSESSTWLEQFHSSLAGAATAAAAVTTALVGFSAPALDVNSMQQHQAQRQPQEAHGDWGSRRAPGDGSQRSGRPTGEQGPDVVSSFGNGGTGFWPLSGVKPSSLPSHDAVQARPPFPHPPAIPDAVPAAAAVAMACHGAAGAPGAARALTPWARLLSQGTSSSRGRGRGTSTKRGGRSSGAGRASVEDSTWYIAGLPGDGRRAQGASLRAGRSRSAVGAQVGEGAYEDWDSSVPGPLRPREGTEMASGTVRGHESAINATRMAVLGGGEEEGGVTASVPGRGEPSMIGTQGPLTASEGVPPVVSDESPLHSNGIGYGNGTSNGSANRSNGVAAGVGVSVGAPRNGQPGVAVPGGQTERVPLKPRPDGATASAADDLLHSPGGHTQGQPGPSSGPQGTAPHSSTTASDLAAIWNLALPSLGAVLSDPLMSLIDTWCVGQLGSVHLAALAPNVTIFNFLFQCMTFLSAATCNQVAHYAGTAQEAHERGGATSEEDIKKIEFEASRAVSNAMVLALGMGVGLLALTQAAGPSLLRAMGCQPEAFGPALEYLRVRSLSAPAVTVMVVAQGASLGRQDAITPLLVYLVAAVLNTFGDVILAVKLNWGVAGTAWATLGAQCLASLVFVSLLSRRRTTPPPPTLASAASGHTEAQAARPPRGQPAAQAAGPLSGSGGGSGAPERQLELRVRWHSLPSPGDLHVFREMALPLIARCFLGMVVYTSIARCVASLGLLQTAAHQVAMQVFWTLSFFSEPLNIAAQSLIALHAGHPKRAQSIAVLLLWIAGGLGTALAALLGALCCCRLPWGVQLASDPEVLVLVRKVAPQSMVSQFLCAVVLTLEGIAIGSGDYEYLPKMQLLNMGVVLVCLLGLSVKSAISLSSAWWCLVVFFCTRLVCHVQHLLVDRSTNVLVQSTPLFA